MISVLNILYLFQLQEGMNSALAPGMQVED